MDATPLLSSRISFESSRAPSPPTLGIPAEQPRLSIDLARSSSEVLEAQRLRYAVFAEEQGATLHTRRAGVDEDEFDRHCRHLLVRNERGELVACTRVLRDDRARGGPGFYSETEFDLRAVLELDGCFLEVGRTCVRADARHGATIALLWSGLATLVKRERVDYLIGCASVPLGGAPGFDGARASAGAGAWALFQRLAVRHLIDPALRVTPLVPLPRPSAEPATPCPPIPPLLKAYLRLGASLGGEPCLDADFGVADLFVLLPTRDVEGRYARHFLGREAH